MCERPESKGYQHIVAIVPREMHGMVECAASPGTCNVRCAGKQFRTIVSADQDENDLHSDSSRRNPCLSICFLPFFSEAVTSFPLQPAIF